MPRKPKLIEPPGHLDETAREQWAKLFPQLAKAKKTTEADLSLFAGYCQSWSRWVAAEKKLAETGPVVRSPQGGAQQSPWLSVARAALRDMHTGLDALALTPKRRRKATADDEDAGDFHLNLLDVG